MKRILRIEQKRKRKKERKREDSRIFFFFFFFFEETWTCLLISREDISSSRVINQVLEIMRGTTSRIAFRSGHERIPFTIPFKK